MPIVSRVRLITLSMLISVGFIVSIERLSVI